MSYAEDPSLRTSVNTETWALPISGIIFGSVVRLSSAEGVIDVSSDVIAGPIEDVEEIFAYMIEHFNCSLGDAEVLEREYGVGTVFPSLSFNVLGNKIDVEAGVLFEPVGENLCRMMIGYSVGGEWTLGLVFLKAYYTVFDYGEQSITISHSKRWQEVVVIEDIVTQELFSMATLILSGEIVAGSLFIFILARLIYGCCQKIEFSVEEPDAAPLISTIDPDSLLAKKIRELKEPK